MWVYILVKLESCPNDFQNHTARPTFFKNASKSRLFGKKFQFFAELFFGNFLISFFVARYTLQSPFGVQCSNLKNAGVSQCFKGKSLLFFFSKKLTFRPIFEKCRRCIVILKIVGATPQLDQNINPQDICLDNFSFVY